MNIFDPLLEELDQWNFEGEEATFWWRDDDAQTDQPALVNLAELSRRYAVPIALAVIPVGAEQSLWELIERYPTLTVLQHGYRHQNHAPEGEKKQELGEHRALQTVLAEIEDGFRLLGAAPEGRLCPVLVPPWNRLSPDLLPCLQEIGLKGLSCFGARKVSLASDNLWIVNTHVDIMQWKPDRKFIGETRVVKQMVSHLQDKRLGVADRAEPTGLLTHHLVHSEICWTFLEQLLATMDDHPAASWLSAERVFQTRWR